MKRGTILFLLIPALLLTSCSSELLPQALASATQDIVGDVKEDNDDVFAEIQRNIDLVAELKAKVQDAQMSNKPTSLDSIIKDIETVTQSFEKLAGQRDDIRKGILLNIDRIDNMRVKVDAEITSLREKRADYTEQLRLINDSSNPEIARTRQKALSQAVKYTDAQIRLWKEFSSLEWDIIIEMSDVQRTIDSFLAMIESSAILFREGLNLLVLVRDINEALALFTSDILRMEQLTSDMEQSWQNLDALIQMLTSASNVDITK